MLADPTIYDAVVTAVSFLRLLFYLLSCHVPNDLTSPTFPPVACCIHSVHNADDTSTSSFLMNCDCHLLAFLLSSSGCNASKKQDGRTRYLQNIDRM